MSHELRTSLNIWKVEASGLISTSGVYLQNCIWNLCVMIWMLEAHITIFKWMGFVENFIVNAFSMISFSFSWARLACVTSILIKFKESHEDFHITIWIT